MAEQSEYQKIRDREPMRSAMDNCSHMATREKADLVLLRQAKDCRDRARDLLNKAEAIEKLAELACAANPDQEEYLYSLAFRSNPAHQ